MDVDEEFLRELTELTRKYGFVLRGALSYPDVGYIELDKLQPFERPGSYQLQNGESVWWLLPKPHA